MIDYQIDKIIAGEIPLVDDFVFKNPCRKERMLASELYLTVYREAMFIPLDTENTILNTLYKLDLWTKQNEASFIQVKKEIDELKMFLYNNRFRSESVKRTKKTLSEKKESLFELLHKRSQLNYTTAESVANSAKVRFLIGCGLWQKNKYWPNPMEDYYKPDNILDDMVKLVNLNTLSDDEIREIAKSSQWKIIWNSCNIEGLFGVRSVDYSYEQKMLVTWSIFYDNIAKSSECPSDDVIEDNDMLDGWILVMKNKRNEGDKRRLADELAGGKSGEIFVPVESLEEAQTIHELNNPAANMLRKQRLQTLNKLGEADEHQLPSLSRVI